MISRLTHQKGMDLLSESIDAILERDVQILFLGTGDERYERMLKDWENGGQIRSLFISNIQAILPISF